MPYGLEKITSKDNPIYHQLLDYYHYCHQVCAMSPQTMSSKIHHINYFVSFSKIKSLEEISNKLIYDWIDYQKSRGNSGRSINNRLSQLKVMLRWQRDDNIMMPNLKISRIVMQNEVPPRKNYFSREQIKKVLRHAKLREWLMIKISFDCGLRIGELLNIRLVDIYGCKIRIIGKGNKLRWTVMSKEARAKLNVWIQQEKIKDYLWPNLLGKAPISQEEARRAMRKVFQLAGYHNFCPHDLRHSYATDLKKLGLSTRQIQMVMGHASEATTERYLSDLDGLNIEEIYKIKYTKIPSRKKLML